MLNCIKKCYEYINNYKKLKQFVNLNNYIPDENLLKKWASSEWIEYQAWIFHKEFMTLDKWKMMRNESINFIDPPLISIITPSYNTDPNMLRECIYSVQMQAYHNWEMCIADDGSKNEATIAMLKKFALEDSRIKLSFAEKNGGICHATNRALEMAKGDYVAFLDHDDRLSVNSLFCVAEEIYNNRSIDVIYSDRDMLSLNGLRFMHLFKPDWSPELLFSMNYICHLMVYRKTLVDRVGGIHYEFEGSQDYDLILRVMELNPVVYHIPKILYHWRQNEQSVALNHDAKSYAYKAGVLALTHALKRRGLKGEVRELSDLWKGHYRVKLLPPSDEKFSIIELDGTLQVDNFVDFISKKMELIKNQSHSYIVFVSMKLCFDMEAIKEMVSWFNIPGVGLVTGKVVESSKKDKSNEPKIIHAGMVNKKDGYPLFIFEGKPESTPGYMAATHVVRNVPYPYPYCFAMRKSLWSELNGFDSLFKGPHAILDFALRGSTERDNRCNSSKNRTVYTPFAKFILKENTPVEELWVESDAAYFADKWRDYLLKGDPYYNEHLTLRLNDMGLNADVDALALDSQTNG
ncbi:MAG: glycosyltransferase [Desulfamplus sp.]|nr:glycosyltransferase [Desulfamplus sp.]